jgi:hypothetical protein
MNTFASLAEIYHILGPSLMDEASARYRDGSLNRTDSLDMYFDPSSGTISIGRTGRKPEKLFHEDEFPLDGDIVHARFRAALGRMFPDA